MYYTALFLFLGRFFRERLQDGKTDNQKEDSIYGVREMEESQQKIHDNCAREHNGRHDACEKVEKKREAKTENEKEKEKEVEKPNRWKCDGKPRKKGKENDGKK